jgi:protein-disulfide isomerase
VQLPRQFRVASVAAIALLAACGADGGDSAAAVAATDATPVASDVGYSTGLEDAPVTVIEFSDFGCPYCAQFALNTYPGIHGEFVLSGQVRWVYVPFVLGIFPNGEGAARAAECAGDQDRFWPMHDVLYDRQPEWRREGASETLFEGYAEEVGLDVASFRTCYAEDHPAERIATSNRLARQASVRATPTFLVNGRPVEGALPPEHFRALLEWAVAAATP